MAGKNRSRLIPWAIALSVVLFLAINVAAGNVLRGDRADLTQNGLYTLSNGTRHVLQNLKEPLHFRFFLSKNLVKEAPQIAAYAARVKTMLETYAELSNGHIRLDVIDPKPYSNEEDHAVGLGIDRVQVPGASDAMFFGLAATNSTDGLKTIPMFSPDREAFLEYDLTRLVVQLGDRGKPGVALIDGLGLSGNPMQRTGQQQILTQLQDFFNVHVLGGDIDSFPKGTDALMVVHPKHLSDRTRYAIDQWVMAGKPAMIFVDPYAETARGPRGQMPHDPSSDLPRLFKAWGVGFNPKKAVADPTYGLEAHRKIGGRDVQVTNYPWLALGTDAMNRSEPSLAQLSTIIVTTAGAFTADKPGVKLEPLLTASPQAGLVDASAAGSPFADPRALVDKIKPPKKPLVIAARLTGKLHSAFAAGKPAKSEAKGKTLAVSAAPANVILVGDADMLMDRDWIQHQQIFGQDVARAFANNGDFVLNAVGQMAGGPALADLRGRGVSWRPFDRIDQLKKKAQEKYLDRQRALTKRISATETKLQNLDTGKKGQGELVGAGAKGAIDQLRADLLSARAELRHVHYELRRNVEHLKTWITAANVGVVPGVVAIFALGAAFRRPKRRLPRRRDNGKSEGGTK